MGCVSNKSNNQIIKTNIEYKDVKINKDNVNLKAEICSSWGYSTKQKSVKDFCEYLKDKGKIVSLDIIPKTSGNGEFYIFLLDVNGKNYPIFSNDKKLHPNSVIAYTLDSKLFSNLYEKIENL